MVESKNNPFQRWGDKIEWKKRVKAVCKPCWELKYCPYGPLVELFPLREERDFQSCLIFGHDCPVFTLAEPLTETRELRNISRTIPRPTQFRVLKRENQICCVCSKPVPDDDIHFDHVIPYSKGGSSDESNIRLLCSQCNLQKGNRFEDEYLVRSVVEHLQPPLELEFLELILVAIQFAHEFKQENDVFPSAQDLADKFNQGKDASNFEESITRTFEDFRDFFEGTRPKEITKRQHNGLKFRWGFIDGEVHPLSEVCSEYNLSLPNFVILERSLLRRIGWIIKDTKHVRRRWENL